MTYNETTASMNIWNKIKNVCRTIQNRSTDLGKTGLIHEISNFSCQKFYVVVTVLWIWNNESYQTLVNFAVATCVNVCWIICCACEQWELLLESWWYWFAFCISQHYTAEANESQVSHRAVLSLHQIFLCNFEITDESLRVIYLGNNGPTNLL